MAYRDGLAVVEGDPTRASQYNHLSENAGYLFSALGKGHDLTSLATANARHYARSGRPMRLELTAGVEYSLAGHLSAGNLRMLLANAAVDALTPTSNYWRELVTGRASGTTLHIGEGFSAVALAGETLADATVSAGFKIRSDDGLHTWTIAPDFAGDTSTSPQFFVKFSDVDPTTLTEDTTDAVWGLAFLSTEPYEF